MDADKEERYADFPVFKGLQKPLEFMGFQGRYIYIGRQVRQVEPL